MRKQFVAAAIAVCAFAGVTRADLILHVGDAVLNPGDSGSVDVWLEETGGTEAVVSTYNVPLRLPLGASTITFTGLAASSSAHPSLFNGQVPADSTSQVPDYNPPNTQAGRYIYATDQFPASGIPQNSPVDNATHSGLFNALFSVGAGTIPGIYSIQVDTDPVRFGLFQLNGNEVPVTIAPGSITVVPEPASVGLLVATGALLRRRRRV